MMNSEEVFSRESFLSAARTEEEKVRKLVNRNGLIFIGSVVSLGDPPDSWSGYAAAYQTVRYKVERILKGRYDAGEIAVEHVVVAESKTSQPGSNPGLSSKLFAPGTELIVFACRADNGSFKALNENMGALPLTDYWLHMIEAAL